MVMQYSSGDSFMYHDSRRSMIGTYAVSLSADRKNVGNSYFVQEVLFIPGFQILKLLK